MEKKTQILFLGNSNFKRIFDFKTKQKDQYPDYLESTVEINNICTTLKKVCLKPNYQK